jgi:single-stranded DNA-binding protein
MIDALIAGRLRGAVTVRQSSNGNTFATWRIAAPGKDGESLLCSCITFSQKAIAAMQALDDGDSVAVSGEASISVWADAQKGQCHGLNVQVYAVMSAYHMGRKRKAHEAQTEGAHQ